MFGSVATYESLGRALQHPIVGRGELAVKYCDVCRDAYQGKKVDLETLTKRFKQEVNPFNHNRCLYSVLLYG